MSTGAIPTQQGLAAEQVYEIQSMAEGGQFADALIRLRKIKAQFPQTTFLVALEKQLERLLVLPRDTDPSEAQKKDLLESLPGLIQGAVQALRSGPPARPAPPPAPPRPAPDRVDREAARTQLKEQYFQHADEYLKKGAYGSALVEIRRVKIIAPDDKTALEYERTIRQLVELQQRAGVAAVAEETVAPAPPPVLAEEQIPDITEADTQWVPAPSIPAPSAHMRPAASPAQEPVSELVTGDAPARGRGGKKWWLFAVILVALIGGTGLVSLLSAADESVVVQQQNQQPAEGKPAEDMNGTPDMMESRLSDAARELPRPVAAVELQKQEVATPQQAHPVAQPRQDAGTAPSVLPAEQSAPPTSAPAEAPGAVETVKPDADPRIVELVHPVFSPEQQAMPSGEVIVMAQIDATGKVLKTMVAKSTNPAFNQAIVTAVLRSTFAAGTTASQPAVKWITIPFRVN
jgi:hypothetical protein